MVITDSIQTMQSNLLDSAAGSISQLKECAAEFQHLAKTTGIPVFLIGHITKDGTLAGPKILEHIVDTVLQFEGDQHYGYRIVRCIKNRFGSTSEMGIFEMTQTGLNEIHNPSEILLSQHEEDYSGHAVASIMEGNRPMMIETQALVSSAVYGMPQRSATGYDIRRMNMLLAVLEKRCRFKLGAKDVFLNIAGGIRVDDPAINLAIVAAILSSATDIAIDTKTCFAGEMGLSGEVRPVSRIIQRIAEADKLGFRRMFISKYNMKGLNPKDFQLTIIPIVKVEEMFRLLFEA
jgi:DNA repair protein RadA/Sms